MPAAAGGNGALAYTLTPTLPAGLTFDGSTDPPTLGGTPSTAQTTTAYTYTASDTDANTEFSDVATLTFTIAVAEDVVPSFGGASIAAQDYITGTEINVTLPAAAGGNGALAYTLTPTLPAGLTFDGSTDPPTLGGTPSTAQAATTYTYTASDADANTEFSDVATLTFTIAVAEDVVPSFGGASIAAQEYITGTAIEIMLPAAAGGNGALAYTLTPALPAGLTFDGSTDPPTLGGTPSTAQTTTAYTYTASDTDANTEFSDVATLTFTIAVAEDVVPSFGGATIAAQEYITGTAINVTLPAAVGGNGALAYTLTPALPAGLRFDPNVDPPTLGGTPSTVQTTTAYTYTASDTDANTEFSDVATLTFTIAVAEDVVPSFGGASIAAQEYITGTEINVTLPAAVGGNGALAYTLTPALPAGLRFDPNVDPPTLGGTPSTVQTTTAYTYTASDADANTEFSDVATLTFTIAVAEDVVPSFGGATIAAQDYITGTAIEIMLPAASGGNGALAYTLTPTLPAGLTFDASTDPPTLGGTPSTAQTTTAYTYTASDTDANTEFSDVATLTFTIAVAEDVVPSFGGASIAAQEYITGTAINVTLPAAAGGNGAPEYTLTPTLPAGLTFDPNVDPPTLSGTPLTAQAATTYTYTASDADANTEFSDVATLTFTIAVAEDVVPSFGGATIAAQEYITGTAINVPLPAAAGGNGALAYTLTPALPAGLTFDASIDPPTLGGTPSTVQTTTAYTYTASDADANTEFSDVATLTFTIAVAEDVVPSFGGASIAAQEYITGTEINVPLPSAAGGNGAPEYTLTPTLPAGLTFDPNVDPPTLSGTPLTAQTTTAYTYTASDADANTEFSDVATLTFTIAVAEDVVPSFGGASIAAQEYITGTEINVTLPAAAGGNGALAYTLTPALPAGLTFDGSTDPPTLGGTPLTAQAATTYTYTASDADANTEFSDVATLTFTIAVAEDVVPSFGGASIAAQEYITGTEINVPLPSAAGGNGALAYTLTPALPAGLRFDESTDPPTLGGTPLTVQTTTAYTYTASDADANTEFSDVATLTFTIAVAEDVVPSFGGASIAAQEYITGTEINVTLPAAAGGNGALAYTLTPALPAGLTFDGSTDRPTLGGTPSTVQTTTAYTYTASDADANTEFSDVATLAFTIAVAEDVVPSFGGASIAAQEYITGTEINVPLPSAVGGNGALAYTLTPALPAGLTFDGSTDPPTLGGTPLTVQTTTAYTYTASDADANTEFSDVATLTFTIAVAEDVVPSFGGASIAAQDYITGTAIEIMLPSASGGNRALAYTLTPALPAGLTFDPNVDPPTLGGTPSTVQTTTAYTYTASDADANTEFSDVATLTFTIAVAEDVVPSFGGASIAAQEYITGTEINVPLPSAAGGNGALAYTLTPALPAGLTFDGSTDPPTLGGTPSTAQTTTAYTYTASDTDANTEFSDVATLTFTIAVAEDVVPSFGGAAIAAQDYITGTAIEIMLPSASGGNGALAYTLTPALPAGLTFDPNVDPPTLGGTPSTVQTTTAYTYTASDADANTEFSDVATLTFTIAVMEELPSTPTFAGDAEIGDLSFTFGRTAETSLPQATGGNGELIYNVSPSLPTGLELHVDDEGMPSLRGRALAVQGVTDYELAVSDSDEDEGAGDSATLTFTIAVTTARVTVSFGEQAVSVTGGTTGMVTVSAAGDVESLGADLLVIELTAAAGIEATPSVVRLSAGTSSAAVTLSVAAGAAGGSVSLSQQGLLEHLEVTLGAPLSVTVLPRTVTLSLLNAPRTLISGEERSLVVTTDPALQGNETAEISVVSSASSILEVVGSSVVILNADTPTGAVTLRVPENLELPQSATLTVSVEDDSNVMVSPSSTEVMIELADIAPSFGAASIAAQEYITDTAINVTLPAAAGGNVALAYTLTPALPAGLTFTSATRTISGTPSTVQTTTAYTYTASDADANTEFSDVATLTFTIAVAEDVVPSFDGASIAAQDYITGTAIEVTLPVAVGGNGAIGYTLTPALPAGLTFTSATRTLSGTPTAVHDATYTYTAMDADANTEFSDVATLTFTIAVAADTAPRFDVTEPLSFVFGRGVQINRVLSPVSGGNGELMYDVSPSLPLGLELLIDDNDLPHLSGRPSTVQDVIGYELVVSDSDANTRPDDSNTLRFAITVVEEPPSAPTFAGDPMTSYMFTFGRTTETSLPSASGGNGELIYSVSSSLPIGLELQVDDEGMPSLRGRALAVQSETSYELVVSDSDEDESAGDSATLTFTIAVTTARVTVSFDEPAVSVTGGTTGMVTVSAGGDVESLGDDLLVIGLEAAAGIEAMPGVVRLSAGTSSAAVTLSVAAGAGGGSVSLSQQGLLEHLEVTPGTPLSVTVLPRTVFLSVLNAPRTLILGEERSLVVTTDPALQGNETAEISVVSSASSVLEVIGASVVVLNQSAPTGAVTLRVPENLELPQSVTLTVSVAGNNVEVSPSSTEVMIELINALRFKIRVFLEGAVQ